MLFSVHNDMQEETFLLKIEAHRFTIVAYKPLYYSPFTLEYKRKVVTFR